MQQNCMSMPTLGRLHAVFRRGCLMLCVHAQGNVILSHLLVDKPELHVRLCNLNVTLPKRFDLQWQRLFKALYRFVVLPIFCVSIPHAEIAFCANRQRILFSLQSAQRDYFAPFGVVGDRFVVPHHCLCVVSSNLSELVRTSLFFDFSLQSAKCISSFCTSSTTLLPRSCFVCPTYAHVPGWSTHWLDARIAARPGRPHFRRPMHSALHPQTHAS